MSESNHQEAIIQKNPKLFDEIKRAKIDLDLFKSAYSERFSEWNKFDVESWSKEVHTLSRIEEVLAVVYKAMQLTTGYKPHDIQLLTVLLMLSKDLKVGRLAQVLTGEGKSLVIAMLVAILKITKDSRADIVTSSEVLAKRDANKWASFYKLLNITVSHNIDDREKYFSKGPKDCYKYDVVYGTAHAFQADILRDEYQLAGTLNGRAADVVIVDEVDNMLIDEHNKSTLLSDEKHGFEKLTNLFLSNLVIVHFNSFYV